MAELLSESLSSSARRFGRGCTWNELVVVGKHTTRLAIVEHDVDLVMVEKNESLSQAEGNAGLPSSEPVVVEVLLPVSQKAVNGGRTPDLSLGTEPPQYLSEFLVTSHFLDLALR